MNKWTKWYESQPQHIKDWMDQPRAIWYDSDMVKAGLTGLVLGFLLGLLF
jgi:alpha-L-arabinofuranosidase